MSLQMCPCIFAVQNALMYLICLACVSQKSEFIINNCVLTNMFSKQIIIKIKHTHIHTHTHTHTHTYTHTHYTLNVFTPNFIYNYINQMYKIKMLLHLYIHTLLIACDFRFLFLINLRRFQTNLFHVVIMGYCLYNLEENNAFLNKAVT